ATAQSRHRVVDVVGAEGDMLDAFAVIRDQIFLNLALVVGALVDGDSNLAAGTRHRLALQSGELGFDVEVADLAEVDQPLVEARPLLHATAMDVVRQVVDGRKPRSLRLWIDVGQRHEVDVVDRYTGSVAAIAVDQIDERISDALDRGDVELHRTGMGLDAPRALLGQFLISVSRILDPKRHRANRGAVHARKAL